MSACLPVWVKDGEVQPFIPQKTNRTNVKVKFSVGIRQEWICAFLHFVVATILKSLHRILFENSTTCIPKVMPQKQIKTLYIIYFFEWTERQTSESWVISNSWVQGPFAGSVGLSWGGGIGVAMSHQIRAGFQTPYFVRDSCLILAPPLHRPFRRLISTRGNGVHRRIRLPYCMPK